MTNLFKSIRFGNLAAAFVFATIVLGIAANLASHFLPKHRDFLIFALVVPTLTMVAMILLALRSQPRVDLLAIFVLSITWLAMGAYSADVIGHVECDFLSGQIPAKHNTTYSAQGYCRQMKVIEAFSWANFVLLIIGFFVLLALTLRTHARGYREIWAASISDLNWFDEDEESRHSGDHHHQNGGYNPQIQYANQNGGQTYTYPNVTTLGNSQPVYQLPGHSVVISQGPNGQQITQVPVNVEGVHHT